MEDFEDYKKELYDLCESWYLRRKQVIRNGQKIIKKKRTYAQTCQPGYKHDDKGTCVRMSADELRKRKKAGKRAQRDPSAKRKRKISLQRRKSLIDN